MGKTKSMKNKCLPHNKVRTTVYLRLDLHRRARLYSARSAISVSRIVNELLEYYLNKRGY